MATNKLAEALAFWNRVDLTADIERCWNWREDTTHQNGYGRIRFQNRRVMVHRIA